MRIKMTVKAGANKPARKKELSSDTWADENAEGLEGTEESLDIRAKRRVKHKPTAKTKQEARKRAAKYRANKASVKKYNEAYRRKNKLKIAKRREVLKSLPPAKVVANQEGENMKIKLNTVAGVSKKAVASSVVKVPTPASGRPMLNAVAKSLVKDVENTPEPLRTKALGLLSGNSFQNTLKGMTMLRKLLDRQPEKVLSRPDHKRMVRKIQVLAAHLLLCEIEII